MNCIYCGYKMFERVVGIAYIKQYTIFNYNKNTNLSEIKFFKKSLRFIQHKNIYSSGYIFKSGFKCNKCSSVILSHIPIKNKAIKYDKSPKFGPSRSKVNKYPKISR